VFWSPDEYLPTLGSEGVSLQAANVLVNFDLPWNPMIVEQRFGNEAAIYAQNRVMNRVDFNPES
jgi:hypothetical protein